MPRTAKNKPNENESFAQLTKRQAAALENLILGAGQSFVDKEGGETRMRRGSKSLDTALATSQDKDIKEERAMKSLKSKRAIGMKKGGAAFPDLTGDGKVTKKDILKGRGVKGFKDGGKTISDADRKKVDSIPRESGKTISDSDRRRVKKMVSGVTQESGKTISDSDRRRVKKMVSGFKEGGEVRGMGKAYMGAPRKVKIK